MAERTCETCRFWDAGDCHRYPPTPVWIRGIGQHQHFEEGWQPTAKTDWCGEHQPRNKDSDQ